MPLATPASRSRGRGSATTTKAVTPVMVAPALTTTPTKETTPAPKTDEARGASSVVTSRSDQQQQQHQWHMLESMERKAREMCDDTRRQYELLLQRQEDQHERQLQTLQNKLKELLSSSLSLTEHRQALTDQARMNEKEMRAMIKVHDDEMAQLRLRFKQHANDQQLQRSRANQEEKDFLLDKMAQLEMDRNDALRQAREMELVSLGVQKELDDALQAKQLVDAKLQEACQHIVTLKAQLPKLERLSAKVKQERITHTTEIARWQQKLSDLKDANAQWSKQVSVLETEIGHLRLAVAAQAQELTSTKSALTTRDTQVTDLQRCLAETATKETLLREFRESERAKYEKKSGAWRAMRERLQAAESEAKQQVAALQEEKRALEARQQLLQAEADHERHERKHSEATLNEAVRAMQVKYARAKQQLRQLSDRNAELQEEDRVNQLLFTSTAPSSRRVTGDR